MCNPGDFGLEAFEVVFFLLQVRLGDEEGEVAVSDAHALEARVEEFLDLFPYGVAGGLFIDQYPCVTLLKISVSARTLRM